MFARIGAVFGGGPVSGAVAAAVLAVLIGAGGWVWLDPAEAPAPKPGPVSERVPDAESAVAASDRPEAGDVPAGGGEPAIPETPAPPRTPDTPVPPSFDVVRVDAAGNALIAGKAAPGSDVTVLVDGDKVSAVAADGSGGFVAMFDLPPAGVPRVVSLSMEDGGDPVASGETVILQPAPAVTAAAGGLDAPAPEGGDAGPVPGLAGPPAGPDLALLDPADPPGQGVPAGDIVAPPEGADIAAAGTGETDGGGAAPGAVDLALAEPGLPEAGDPPGQPAPIDKPDVLALPGEPDAPRPGTDPALAAQPPQPVDLPGAGPAPDMAAADNSAEAEAEEIPGTTSTKSPDIAPDTGTADVAGTVSPDTTVPDTAAPDMAAPDAVAVDTATPGAAMPDTAAPGTDAPEAVAATAEESGPTPPDSPDTAAADMTSPGLAGPDAPSLAAPAGAGGAASLPGTETAPAPAQAAPTVLLADAGGIRVLQSGGTRPAPVQSVIIDTISYDPEGEVALGGRAAGKGFVRVYLDNKPVKTTEIGVDGQWRTPLPEVDTGIYTLRVDEIGDDGSVVSRMETPFKREEPEVLAALEGASGGTDPEGTGARTELLTVQPGNTLWGIADDRYGDGLMYVRVFDANRARIRDPHWIYPGQVFALPQ